MFFEVNIPNVPLFSDDVRLFWRIIFCKKFVASLPESGSELQNEITGNSDFDSELILIFETAS